VRALAAVAAGVLLAAPAAATAQQRIGANLNRPANVNYGCETLPTTDFVGNRFFLPTGQATCTYLAAGQLGNTTETTAAPQTGIVTRIFVKTGAGPVGPMEATVLTATRSTTAGGLACCFHFFSSQTFVPAQNAITAVNVRLPMLVTFSLDPSVGERVDRVALSVLAPGVAIPAFDGGVPGDISRPCSAAWYPHIRPGEERADSSGICDFVPLLAADFFPLCQAGAAARVAGAGRARPSQGGRCLPLAGIAGRQARLRNGRAVMTAQCNLPVACDGRLLLQSARARGARASAVKTYAKAQLGIPPGGTKKLKPKLTKAGRALMRGRQRAKVFANAKLTGGGQKATASSRITLKR
jgi:hypothetical protein